ncbi:MAG: hypothetical protein JSR61_16690 [Proteobacteria bacterium]|nr:hypothetical protein [Pseudomonadota bacterium]
MGNIDFEQRKPNNRTFVSQDTLQRADAHYAGKIADWRKHHSIALKRHRTERNFFDIAVTQLFETYEGGNNDALRCLDRLVNCTQSSRCCQIFCPSCRGQRQDRAASDLVCEFQDVDESEIKFMTLLIGVEQDAAILPQRLAEVRQRLRNALHNNKASLAAENDPLCIVGAFECDLKNLGTQADASRRTQELVKSLGFDPKHKPSQYLLHLHAVAGRLDEARQEALRAIIGKALGGLLPYQLDFRSLYASETKEENLARLGHYMYKARLQFADNIFDDNWMQKRAKYHTPYKGKELVDYLNVIDEMQNFKGLKFECRL